MEQSLQLLRANCRPPPPPLRPHAANPVAPDPLGRLPLRKPRLRDPQARKSLREWRRDRFNRREPPAACPAATSAKSLAQLLPPRTRSTPRSSAQDAPASPSPRSTRAVSHPSASMAASRSTSCLFRFGFPTNCIPLNSTTALNSFVLRCFVLYLGGVWPARISSVCSRLLGFIPSFMRLLLPSSSGLRSLARLVSRPNTNLPSHRLPATSSCTANRMYLPSL
jgi:hypothetical protein